MRRRRLVLGLAAGALFHALSGLLARLLSVEGQERDAVMAVLRDQARGDAEAVLRRLSDCDAACEAAVRDSTAHLSGPGDPKLVRLDSGTSYALGSAVGTSRIVWVRGAEGRPVVQCAEVERKGSVLAERTTRLRRLSPPLGDNEAPC